MVFVTQLRSLGTSLLAAACACAMLLSAAGARATDLPQFLVVDYHPLSKTLAAGSTPAHPLYDYVYRIDMRNAGAAAANVSGAVRSRLPSITVPDASADFGAVGAHQTKASTDTITLRANQFFDRRLDRKVSVNGKSQYQVAGNDEDDSQIPGLPLLPGLVLRHQVPVPVPVDLHGARQFRAGHHQTDAAAGADRRQAQHQRQLSGQKRRRRSC
jgi:hypothetical protein